jgi:hypothetical protein
MKLPSKPGTRCTCRRSPSRPDPGSGSVQPTAGFSGMEERSTVLAAYRSDEKNGGRTSLPLCRCRSPKQSVRYDCRLL